MAPVGAVASRIEPGPLRARGRRRRRASPKMGTEAPVAIVTDIIVGGGSMVLVCELVVVVRR